MSWFSSLFKSGPDAASKVLDAGIRGIDALIYTDEEKAVAKQKLLDGWLKLQETLANETTTRSVTRRVMACVIVFPYVLLVLAGVVVYPFNMEYSQFLMSVANSQFGTLAIGVATFYFGPYMIGRAFTEHKKEPGS